MKRIAFWLFSAFAVLYVATTRGHFTGTDEITIYQATRSIWEEGSLATNARLPTSFPARGGGTVGAYSPAQSILAVPLYGLGKAVDRALRRAGRGDWVRTLAGPVIESGGADYRWGGDVEIFFVNLLNAFVTALLVSIFFLFSVDLGATVSSALSAAFLIGLATYIAPFSTGFLQHPLESALILAAFRYLFLDARSPSRRIRFRAGACLALLILLRPQSVIAVPALAGYGLIPLWRRRRDFPSRESFLRRCAPLLGPVALAIAADIATDQVKFGVWTRLGMKPRFGLPSLTALHGFLLSPGDSLFLYTPLLLLLPWLLRVFFRRHRLEAAAATLLSVSYLFFYASFKVWHGLWSAIGPRYLVPVVPVLLLPLAEWIDARGRARAWVAIAPLAVAGFFVQAVNAATNFGFVANHEGYPAFRPKFGFLFVPAMAPILAEARTVLFEGGARVDMWLLNVGRELGPSRLLEIALPLAGLFAFSLWRIARALRRLPRRAG
ncbi:MAG: hypothetical protein ACRD16_06435 [Thermoanaerobaculia bacterium]